MGKKVIQSLDNDLKGYGAIPVNDFVGLSGDVQGLTSQMADIVTVNNHSITYGYDTNGNVQTVTEKDSSNNVIKTVTYTYDSSTGNVTQSVTVMNGKTVTTTYTYDPTNGNITSTTNVIS